MNACRPPSFVHDLDYRTTLILVADTFDPAFGKSIIHDSVLFDWSGFKNNAVRTSEATAENSAALRTFALVQQTFRYCRAYLQRNIGNFCS